MTPLVRKLWLPAVALAALGLTARHVVLSHQSPPDREPASPPSRRPFSEALAGSGLIEARLENVAVGAHLPGVVSEVAVVVGQRVAAGDLLFRVDDRHLQAELKVREAQLATAQAALARLQQSPRPELIPPSEARVRRAEAELAAQRDRTERVERLVARRAVSEEELVQQRQALAASEEALRTAQAEDALLKAGAWGAELSEAEAELVRARALVEQTRTELTRLDVRALQDGQVLQVNVRPGEFVSAPPLQPLMVIGDLSQLHVRVDVDEQDIPRFREGLPGLAYVRGDAARGLPVRFVRIEPYVIPKQSLTGDAQERVDTRVLQAIYALDPPVEGVFVGQQVDVYLDAGAATAGGPARVASR